MSTFGETLFGGSRFVRWSLTPVIFIFAASIPFLVEMWTPSRIAATVGIEALCVALLAGIWLPPRIGRWAFRGFSAMIFLAYAGYLIHELFVSGTPFKISESRAEPSAFNAFLGFIIIGLPSLWYAIFGRFTLRRPNPHRLYAPSPERVQARENLYATCFEVLPRIYHSSDDAFPHIDVYHFVPTNKRDFHTLITGGMAEYRQPVNDLPVPARLELMFYLRTFQEWSANLIKAIAEYPAQNDTFFSHYHTVPIGYRLTDSSEISAVLLAPPETADTSKLSFTIEGEPVNYLLCVPITMAEHAFAIEFGSEQLHQKLKQADLLIHTDDHRRSIVDQPITARE